MNYLEVIKWVCSFLELCVGTALTFVLYRFKIKQYAWTILLLSLITTVIVNMIFYKETFISFVPLINILLQLTAYVVIVRVPIFFALIMSVTGFFIMAIIECIVLGVLQVVFHLSKNDNNLIFGLALSAIIAFVMFRFVTMHNIGFMFIEKKMKAKEFVLKPYNYVVILVLSVGLILMTYIEDDAYHSEHLFSSIMTYIVAVMMFGTVVVGYILNRKQLNEFYRDKRPSDYLQHKKM